MALGKSCSMQDDVRQEKGTLPICEENLESAKQEVI